MPRLEVIKMQVSQSLASHIEESVLEYSSRRGSPGGNVPWHLTAHLTTVNPGDTSPGRRCRKAWLRASRSRTRVRSPSIYPPRLSIPALAIGDNVCLVTRPLKACD